ncbi:MAG: alanine:cation symporter family protein, partial [Lachnospiraceae bacterium]|nr:alanine:cation symporter family protein [Lachnospiraceae bacterium]
MIEIITNINNAINGVVWGWPALILLGFVGVLMTVLTKFFQVSHFGHWLKNTIGAIFGDKHVTQHTEDKTISQFQSLCTALAATVGTGNIVGVAGAIATGGPGAVFWMWLIAFFGMMTNYSENVLGILYRRKGNDGEWHGGAMYYLKNGLGAKPGCKQIGTILAVLFSLFCLLASFGIGNMSQVNSMVANVETAFGIPTLGTGIFLFVAVGLVIIGGLKRIASTTEKIVPFMVILYLVGTLVIIVMHITAIPAVFVAIFKGAFAMKSVAGGIVGSGIALAMKMGFKRGVFSNEAGLGSSVMVHSSSNVKEPVRQGMWGIFEVFADTIIVCTLTALTILSSGAIDLETGMMTAAAEEIGSSSLMSYSFAQTFGKA